MKPSDFTKHPYDSVMMNCEAEVVALNIMVIMARTGDKFRELSWNEYQEERQKDGNFTLSEKPLFEKVSKYCVLAETARLFSPAWQ